MPRKSRPAASKPKRAPSTVSKPELLVEGSDTQFRSLVHDLMAFAHHIEACRDGFGAIAGLTGVQYEIFMAVKRFHSVHGAPAPARGGFELVQRMQRRGRAEKYPDQ